MTTAAHTDAPTSTTLDTLDQLEALVGRTLGASDWLQVGQERVNTFADATGDHQWIHTDPERAASGPFGGTIAHGYLTLSLAPAVIGQVLRIDTVRAALNYGLNKVRFPAPVPVGTSLRGTLAVVSAQRRGPGVEAVFSLVLAADGSARPACVAECVVVYQ